MPENEVNTVDDPLEPSDADFLEWAGADPRRWSLLPGEKRDAWLDHLVARIRVTSDEEQRNGYWRLAYAIACADAHGSAEDDFAPRGGPPMVEYPDRL
jgi:hypothetical protein